MRTSGPLITQGFAAQTQSVTFVDTAFNSDLLHGTFLYELASHKAKMSVILLENSLQNQRCHQVIAFGGISSFLTYCRSAATSVEFRCNMSYDCSSLLFTNSSAIMPCRFKFFFKYGHLPTQLTTWHSIRESIIEIIKNEVTLKSLRRTRLNDGMFYYS